MKKLLVLCAALVAGNVANAQNFRPQSKDGINVFEYKTPDSVKFDGVKVKVGGAFTQSYQALNHSNTAQLVAVPAKPASPGNAGTAAIPNANELYKLKPGFNTAVANLNFDVALADGIDLKMEMYLSARHHNETWVKGGFIQFNKLPFLKCGLTDAIMKNTVIKVGHMGINYGDAQFRRSDNGNTIYNPFVENYIMDAFATEIGIEIDYMRNGFIGVLGMTNGQIKGDLSAPSGFSDSTSTGDRRPAFLGKFGWDGKVMENFRVRATGSFYYTAGSTGVTLYSGDRGGSNYYGVMDNVNYASASNFTSGRFNPGMGDQITSYMGNLLLEYKLTDKLSVESFSTYEVTSGKAKTAVRETKATQIASDLIIRYGNFFVGGRYNTVDCDYPLSYSGTTKVDPYSVSINRTAIGGGWFITKNVMAKAEYVTQKYDGFKPTDIRNGGKFDGFSIQAVVAF